MRNDPARRSMHRTPGGLLRPLIVLLLVATASVARPQGQHANGNPCAPRAATRGPTFVFGNDGGNLRRSAVRLWADGSARVGAGPRSAPDAAIADSVRALALLARESAFWTTVSPRITRPTRNPDMTREYVEVHLRCGSKRSLYPADAEPAAFHELFVRLSAVAKLAAAR